jgi:FkbH-like protein
MACLRERGIAEYFVFPSISWEPKGERIARLIEAVQLRPASVMFIDNDPANRAEARTHVPEIQLAPETFIPDMLAYPRFLGRDDPDLTRLRQYQLLETRQAKAAVKHGTNDDFLRQSNIRICIEYDVLAHADRVIELVNRTNQLNYTKSRFPEDAEQARAV